MPKGDRLKLKADPEDGTTPVANLLLEAVAMAKLSGLQKGAIIYLWRQTYGWMVDGKRLKECKITLKEWEYALCTTKSRISAALKDLELKNIFHRRVADQWGGYYYTLNTDISKWNSNTINLARLAETVTVHHFGTVDKSGTVTKRGNSIQKPQQLHEALTPKATSKKRGVTKTATVAKNRTEQLTKAEPPTSNKEILKKGIKKEGLNKSSTLGEDTKKVFEDLDKLRGYRPTVKRKAEAASIIRMLKADYTPEQIISTWQKMKQDKFYADKELYMMSVESQIGAVTKGVRTGTHQQRPPGKAPESYTKPDELRHD